MATYIITKIEKDTPCEFYTVKRSYFLDVYKIKMFTLLSLDEALNKVFSLPNCKKIIIN